ncbi:copper chaperone PCu(A)C [Sphingomonas sp. BK235]|uniref:copper chaperone PCu(A)C n=1 Tax=Sphingomonas sp. BK235 TaxID=2512131 RepID=UPI0010E8BD84|nr:copper chaperone PCu(A)C [Sphingomonas sp. BK235]TCP35965.1 hypothetical protein EV292_102555 [Sphingomonas sp. BK235]
MTFRWTLAAPMLLAACSTQPAVPDASEAYVRLAAIPGRPAAGYFLLHGGAKDAVLVGAEAPGAARAELHTSRRTGNGMASMDSIARVAVPARGRVAFAPGGQHVMLFGLPASVAPGSTLPLTLRFADGSATLVAARVIAAGDAAPE